MSSTTRTAVGTIAAVATTVCLLAGCSIAVDTGRSPAPSSAGDGSGTSSAPAGIDVPTPSIPSIPSVDPSVPTATGGTAPSPGSAGGRDDLPPAFPLPGGATVASGTRTSDEIDASITVQDGDAAARFWRTALPAAGYTVTSADSGFGASEIRFRGHGCAGNSQIAVTGTTAAVQCDLS